MTAFPAGEEQREFQYKSDCEIYTRTLHGWSRAAMKSSKICPILAHQVFGTVEEFFRGCGSNSERLGCAVAMRVSCFCSWSSCRRSCSAPTVFSCCSASTPFRMPSSLVMTGSNFSSSFFSMVSPTASRMTPACSERSLSSFLSSLSSNLPNSAFNSALVTGAFALFGSFSIHRGLYLKCMYIPETVNACKRGLRMSQESHDFCHVRAVAGTMSFVDGSRGRDSLVASRGDVKTG